MIVITYTLVISGFEWWYFTASRNPLLHTLAIPAIILGGILPIILPLILFILGTLRKNKNIIVAGWALAQAALIGSLISSTYKAFTGRIPPMNFAEPGTLIDISRQFQFGFMRGGIFWGWPSSHTTIAFAMAVTLFVLYPTKKAIFYPALIYALYVGLSVSVSIHWLSEFIAGAILGTIIGIVVGTSFKKK